MNRRPFSYCVLRYVHDAVAAESMNIGVVVYSAEARFLDVSLMHQYRRLSEAFVGFDGDGYKRTLRAFEERIVALRDELFSGLLSSVAVTPDNVEMAVRRIWPDQQLSIRASGIANGLSDDLIRTTRQLFERFVASQYTRTHEERRSDDQVWETYAAKLHGTVVPTVLREVTFSTENLTAQFRGFKNEKWHLLQPVSLDYLRENSITRKAKEFLGEFVELSDNEDVRDGHLYLLLGAPTHPNFRKAYERAKEMLKKIPVTTSIVEEDAAESFAIQIDEYVKEHGVA